MTVTVTGQAIDTLFLEERRYPPDPEFAAQANAKPDLYARDFEELGLAVRAVVGVIALAGPGKRQLAQPTGVIDDPVDLCPPRVEAVGDGGQDPSKRRSRSAAPAEEGPPIEKCSAPSRSPGLR